MKSYFEELVAFNQWADQIAMRWIQELNKEQWLMPITSSFSSIRATTIHLAAAEQIWLDRLKNTAQPIWLGDVELEKAQALELWTNASAGLVAWVQQMNDGELDRLITFKRLNGNPLEMKAYRMIAHVVNHSTYHRGQLVTMLRQVGYENLGSTDMLGFFRSQPT
jgi:uncharacterized damage-inducible protein DinB